MSRMLLTKAKLLHIGVIVSPYIPGLDASIQGLQALGYTCYFRIRRSEPWIGELVGIKGADIEIAHLSQGGERPGLELLAYWSNPSPARGVQHLAYEVDDIEEALKGDWVYKLRGRATIPDGPNAGTKCAYVTGLDGDTLIELIEKPK